MSNLYAIIVGLFALTGLLGAIWSGLNIRKAKKTAGWLPAKGVITRTMSSAEAKDFSPLVEYGYEVAGQKHSGTLKLASSDAVLPEFATASVEKYPVDAVIDVFYDPESHAESTLEPGVKKDDWLVFVLCMVSLTIGFIFLLLYI